MEIQGERIKSSVRLVLRPRVIQLFIRNTQTSRSLSANHQLNKLAMKPTNERQEIKQTRTHFLQYCQAQPHRVIVLINLIGILFQGLHVHGHGSTETYLTYVGQNMYELLVSFPAPKTCKTVLIWQGRNERRLLIYFNNCVSKFNHF